MRFIMGFIVATTCAWHAAVSADEPIYAPQKRQATPIPFRKLLGSFTQLRHELLNLIGGAKKRIWLSTDYLTDGEIVSALYIANYRKVDVKILLGAQKAQGYMSRLNYLKKQNTPVFIKPNDFGFACPSCVLIDERLYLIDSDLDFKTRQSQFSIKLVRPADAMRFQDEFMRAANLALPAVPQPIPMVGRPRYHQSPRQQPVPQYRGDKDGSYNYNKSSTGYTRSGGVPKKLPKVPLYEQRGRKEEAQNP